MRDDRLAGEIFLPEAELLHPRAMAEAAEGRRDRTKVSCGVARVRCALCSYFEPLHRSKQVVGRMRVASEAGEQGTGSPKTQSPASKLPVRV